LNFAVCVDANAGARRAARQRAREKDAAFAQKKLQFFNKETSLSRAQNRNIIGYGRDLSDAYVRAIYTQGKGRLRNQELVSKYFKSKKVNEGGRGRRFGKAQYLDLLRQQSQIESINRNNFGRNMAYAQTGATRKLQAANARSREKLGIPAAYGAPVMLPPTDRLTGALSIASSVAGIYGGFFG
jgi:hypothetical protein